ncbi:predicted protein [Naegleria gruberi]|uniref:Predicted protein n=1 Tax=Naegleria gruberi TaxID=5762 RepID=D2VMA2_NAEGR|nr:uncharacterized protein NAEGRDRAFT_70063 [Naegleria gruberi]EFC41952.1 predicted protein [Naegleria gruberi]|eukprot:XP_002674696.1 predicted protein [Naegleria gruberi strain NEG-M]
MGQVINEISEYFERKKEIKEIVNSYPSEKVYLLDRDSLLIEEQDKKIRILGCTLWSNVPSRYERDISSAINDYKVINIKDGDKAPRVLTVEDTNRFHKEDVEWIKSQLEMTKENNEIAVVLTHHAPLTQGTSHPKHDSSIYSYAFSTHLESIIKENPQIRVWGYGHSHYTNSIQCHLTQVVSNQLGYRVELDNVNGFDPDFSIDI